MTLSLQATAAPGRCSNTGPRPRHKCTGGTSTVNESSLNPDDIAIRTRLATVEITCPSWCQVAVADHAARLWANEGRCIHQVLLTITDPTGKQPGEQPR